MFDKLRKSIENRVVNILTATYQHEECGYICKVFIWNRPGKRWFRIRQEL